MADKFLRGVRMLLRQFALYARMDLLWFLRDTKYCLFYVFADLVCAGASAAGVFFLSERFGGFGGLARDEILLLLCYAVIADGLYALFFTGYNMSDISRIIGRGQLDHCMVQPVPLWMQFLTGGFSPCSGSGKLIAGAGLTAWAAMRLRLDGVQIAGLAVGAVSSTAIVAAFVNLVSCLAFVSPAGAEEIAGVAHSPFQMLGFYPLGGLSPLWRTFFCTVIPVGVFAWLPCEEILSGMLPVKSLLLSAALTAVMLLTFRKGMIYYATYGCPRYSGFGHR